MPVNFKRAAVNIKGAVCSLFVTGEVVKKGWVSGSLIIMFSDLSSPGVSLRGEVTHQDNDILDLQGIHSQHSVSSVI